MTQKGAIRKFPALSFHAFLLCHREAQGEEKSREKYSNLCGRVKLFRRA